jgi:hypothetical protein
MADAQLPLIPSVPFYRVSTTLDDDVFLLDLKWNTRDAAWYMTILTPDEDVIVAEVKIVLGTLLGARSTDPRMPAGILQVCDLAGTGVDATLDDLGERVVIYYTPIAEFAALVGE